jgi:hypothetical protein
MLSTLMHAARSTAGYSVEHPILPPKAGPSKDRKKKPTPGELPGVVFLELNC